MEGEDHLVLADQGCRNTVFNAQTQTGAEYIQSFVNSGIKHYRIELVDEGPEHVQPLVEHYQRLLQVCSPFSPPIHTTTTPIAPTAYSTTLVRSTSSSSSAASISAYNTHLAALYTYLNALPNKYGKTHGHSPGSLKPVSEVKWATMKPTAYQKG